MKSCISGCSESAARAAATEPLYSSIEPICRIPKYVAPGTRERQRAPAYEDLPPLHHLRISGLSFWLQMIAAFQLYRLQLNGVRIGNCSHQFGITKACLIAPRSPQREIWSNQVTIYRNFKDIRVRSFCLSGALPYQHDINWIPCNPRHRRRICPAAAERMSAFWTLSNQRSARSWPGLPNAHISGYSAGSG